MAMWFERRISRHDFYLSRGFLAVSVLFIAIWMNVSTSCVTAQSDPSQEGFISIACGSNSNFKDGHGLNWVTDVNSTFISTGSLIFNETANVSSRVFPERRNKHCYELQPVSPSTTYLFRATFYFDPGLMASLPITFDVSINATTVCTMTFDSNTPPSEYLQAVEVIFFSPGNVTYVCLLPVDGVPFITTLELRPLDPLMYSYAGSQTQYLVNLQRSNIGASSNAPMIRYPEDQYDRFWLSPHSSLQDMFPRVNASAPPDTTPRPEVNSVPPAVMKDAWGGVPIPIIWSNLFSTSSSGPLILNPVECAYVAVYAEELVSNSTGGEMNIALDNNLGQNVTVSSQANMFVDTNFILSANSIEFFISTPDDRSAISVNAVEFYGQFNFNFSKTAEQDYSAIKVLQEGFSLTDWQGDPCTPVPHDWLSCEVGSAFLADYPSICNILDENCTVQPSFLRSMYSVVTLNLSNLPASGFGFLQSVAASEGDKLFFLLFIQKLYITESGVTGSIFQFLINDFCHSYHLNLLDFTSNNIENLPIGENWGQLDTLQYLNLSQNSITGDLSPFYKAPFADSLQVLNVSYNSLTSIRPSINNTWTNGTTALVVLDLSHNKIVGDISSLDALVQLSAGTLQELYVSNNSFTGTLSPLYFNLANLTIANFDGNSIQGTLNLAAWFAALEQNSSTNSSIPMTQKLFSFVDNSIGNIVPSAAAIHSTVTRLRTFDPHFSTNGILLGGNPFCKVAKSETEQYLCRSKVNDPIIPPRDSHDTVLITGVCVGVGVLLVACVAVAIMWNLWKKAKKQVHALEEIQRALADRKVQPPFFQYSDLRLATRDFHEDNLLGRGSFGEVHKGVLSDSTHLAVKTLFSSGQALDEFLNEVVLITGIKHRNLVQLKGCCINNEQRMLVYEFAEKGNLAEALWGFRSHGVLNWKERLNICVGVARGLSYLHEELQPAIIHRDIKPANILLDKNLLPKIADFGLARVFSNDTSATMYTKIAGTLGYFSPEYATQGQLSEKADVYSYGIVVLETISGRQCIDNSQPIERVYLKNWVLGLKRNGLLLDALQQELRGSCEASEVLRTINIGLQCVHHDPTSRPSMSQIVNMFLGHSSYDPLKTSLEKSVDGHPIQELLGITTQKLGLPWGPHPPIRAESTENPLLDLEASSSGTGSSRLSKRSSSKTMIQLSPLVGQ